MKYTFNENGMVLEDGTKIPFCEIMKERNRFRFKNHVLLRFRNVINGREYYFNEVIKKSIYDEIEDKLENLTEIYLGENPDDGSDFMFKIQNSYVVIENIDDIVDFVTEFGIVYKNSNFDIIEAIDNQE